jgi:hypothetical protein
MNIYDWGYGKEKNIAQEDAKVTIFRWDDARAAER